MELFHTGCSAGPLSFKGLPWARATLLMASLSREAPHNVWGRRTRCPAHIDVHLES